MEKERKRERENPGTGACCCAEACCRKNSYSQAHLKSAATELSRKLQINEIFWVIRHGLTLDWTSHVRSYLNDVVLKQKYIVMVTCGKPNTDGA